MIIILGGSLPQCSAANACVSLGLIFFILDRDVNCAASILYPDSFIPVDIIDVNKITLFIETRKLKPSLFVTTQSDVALSAVAKLNTIYSRPGITEKNINIFTNKLNFSVMCKKYGINHPLSASVKSFDELPISGVSNGIVIKPIISSGSRGVTIFEESKNLCRNFVSDSILLAEKNCENHTAMAQEYIFGVEMGAQGLFDQSGRLILIAHTDIMAGDYEHIPVAHGLTNFDKALTKQLKFIEKKIQEMFVAERMPPGVYNLDFILKEEKLFLIEASPRVGATCIEDLIFHGYSISPVKKHIQLLLGEYIDGSPKLKQITLAGIMYANYDFTINSKIINSIADIFGINYLGVQVVNFNFERKLDDQVKRILSGRDRFGSFVISASNYEVLLEYRMYVSRAINDVLSHHKDN
jgi:predicted ATP-grasp superfamily ATP-dependent carboligase